MNGEVLVENGCVLVLVSEREMKNERGERERKESKREGKRKRERVSLAPGSVQSILGL